MSTATASRPTQMLWCGDCVPAFHSDNSGHTTRMTASSTPCASGDRMLVLYWPQELYIIGGGQYWVKHQVEEDVEHRASAVLCADVDGVHIVTPYRHEYIQHVPSELLCVCVCVCVCLCELTGCTVILRG